jgi:hypothetical protein
MNVLIRAALVGTVIGLVEVCIHFYKVEDDFRAANTLIFTPFLVGLLLGWLVRLPRWWQVAILAPFLNGAIIIIALQDIGLREVTELGVLLGCFVFAAIGIGGHVAAAAMLVPGNRIFRASVVGSVIIAFTGVFLSQNAIAETARTRRLAHSGVPLLALGVQEYRPTRLTESFDESSEEPPSVELHYERLRDRSEIDLYVTPESAGLPKDACLQPVPLVSYGPDTSGTCRQVSATVWARTEPAQTRVFAKHGDALVQITSETVSEADLLAVLLTLRPSTAEELAAVHQI